MRHIKNFIKRGLLFGGFGPIILGIIYLCISMNNNMNITGSEAFIAIMSTYFLAFIHAGCSVFKEVEDWSLIKTTGLHLLVLYITYTLCYLINSWIPFKWSVLVIYTILFVVGYFIIWLTVYLIVRKQTKKMNEKLKL